MKDFFKKISNMLRIIFGYGIMVCLFAGGLTFFGYVAALIIGGDTAATICDVIYNQIIPIIIKTSTILVLLGLVVMYLNGETALTANKKKSSKHQGEL
ncbi:MAG: hypothetical protein J6Q76_02210 [Clostridia bacterium]|nr:hypothetical protein [Clostridia bacterium]MBO5912266.1 hypothetical protein [Clostridia bacterium]